MSARRALLTALCAGAAGPGIDAFKAVTTTIKIVRHVLGRDD